MHVAGKDVAKYDGVGSTHLFPAKLFHRSGAAPRRCVKVAFFFKGIQHKSEKSPKKLKILNWRPQSDKLAS